MKNESQNTLRFDNRVALVTGAGRGLGREHALLLASRGCAVVVNDLGGAYDGGGCAEQKIADEVVAEIRAAGGVAHANYDSVEDGAAIIDDVINAYGRLDIVVNNAGITRDGLMVRMQESDWDLVLDINLKGSFLCSQQAAKQMMKQKSGAIVNIASIVGVMGNFGQANYSASKAGVIGLTKTLAREVASRGIRVNAIAPGFIDTEMTRVLDEEVRQKLIEQIPLARLGLPEDVARCVNFLVSDKSSYITGQVINLNGGMLM